LDEARGDFWTGVGYYHSHDPGHKADYLRKVLAQARRLQAASSRAPAPAASIVAVNDTVSMRGY
jgi:hypothetical protein